MVKTVDAPAADAPASGAAAPESLASLAAEATLLDTSPEREAQAGQMAQAAELVQSNEAELYGTLQAIRAMAFPMLSMVVDAQRMAQLGAVWNDGVLQSTASAGAAVLERHGITMGQVMGQFGPYIMLVAAVAPPVMLTKKILSAPKDKAPGQAPEKLADGQQQ
ncbi:hypothetical protein SRS16CHR_02705 [Variovorax sp. SRS16]|uniref:hypothetical protein n=1 Tax=Variovorax sp. SRS16 TaxID=282217 RepID=UPI001316517E|nr:hypothetical protein [Variovorax sp. SRS16]VTU20744.1 hypothetical protein SRS16CHR_02705 [Variovorax sp. SRS16]